MDDFITCIKCNTKYDAKCIQRDFRYRADGEPFGTCVYCRGIRKQCHMICDICHEARIHYHFIWLVETGNYHSTCSDCLGESERHNIVHDDRAILDKYKRR